MAASLLQDSQPARAATRQPCRSLAGLAVESPAADGASEPCGFLLCIWLLGMRAFSVGDHVFGQAPQSHPRSPLALTRGSPPLEAPFDTQRCCCVGLPKVLPKWAAGYMISKSAKLICHMGTSNQKHISGHHSMVLNFRNMNTVGYLMQVLGKTSFWESHIWYIYLAGVLGHSLSICSASVFSFELQT